MLPRPMNPTRIVSSASGSPCHARRPARIIRIVVVSGPPDDTTSRKGTMMRLGVVFPQTEIGNDPAVIRDYAQAAEGAGYDHLLVFDHVLGATLPRLDKLGRRPPYTDQSSFHEPFVLFGYLGACTQRLELVT